MTAFAALAALLAVAAPRPAAPAVVGPRDTTLERPVYTFRARGAIGFRCAFDTTLLHRCARRYSQALEPGAHRPGEPLAPPHSEFSEMMCQAPMSKL